MRGQGAGVGPLKVAFVRKLGADWEDLADFVGIRPDQKATFPPGREAGRIWEWLERRDRLGELRGALQEIDRGDLADLIGHALDQPTAEVEAASPVEVAVLVERQRRAWKLADDSDVSTHWLPRARGADPGAGGSAWHFTGRHRAVARIAEFLTKFDIPRAPLVVIGEPGTGKSSLLAHVLMLADPDLRETMPERYRTPVTEALVGSVDLAVRATGKSLDDVVAMVGRAAGVAASDADRLIAAVHDLDSGLRIVVDALDEAEPEHIKPIALLLRQLSVDPDGRGTRVVVGVRRAPAGSSLADMVRLSLRATPDTTLPVDRAPYLVYEDVVDYVERRLEGSGRSTPYTGRDLAGRVARAVVGRAGGNFLVAQMASRNLAEEPHVVDTRRRRWWSEFPVDVESAMDQYLARFGDEERLVRELLTPLAFAHGDGLPDNELWVIAAQALSSAGHDYQMVDLSRVLDRAATYLVAAEGTYRLFHDALSQYLRNRCTRHKPERDLVRAWRSALGRPVDWSSVDRYLVTYLAQHAADGEELDELVRDVRFVATAEPGNLTSALRLVRTEDGRRVARAYRQVPTATAGPPERAAYLALSAQQLGDTELRDSFLGCGLDLPWSVLDGAWRPPDDHSIVARLEETTTAVTVLPAEHGAAYVISGDSGGRLWIREIADGVAFPASRLDAHLARVSAVAGCFREDGLHLLVSGSEDGEVQLRQVDSGLASPAPERFPVGRSIIDLAVMSTSTGSLVVVADRQDGLWLLRFGVEGATVVARTSVRHLRRVALQEHNGGVRVVATTADHAVVLVHPDGQERWGFSVGRWSVNAIAVEERSGTVLFGTGGREVLILDPSFQSIRQVVDAAASGISALSPVLPQDDVPYGGVLLGDVGGVVQFWPYGADGSLSRDRVWRPHQDDVLALSVMRGPSGTSAVSCGRDGKVALGELISGDIDDTAEEQDVDLAAASPGTASATVLLREGSGVERWALEAGRRPVLRSRDGAPGGTRVTGTVDGRGVSRQFRSDLDTNGAGPRRPIRLHPVRDLAVATLDGGPRTLALHHDGQLELYESEELARPVARIPTGVQHPVSLSVGQLASGEPVVVCGDVEGTVWLNRWRDVQDWSRSSQWHAARADVRTAVASDHSGRDLLLTGDATGDVCIWQLAGDGLRALGGPTRHHAVPITAVALASDGRRLAAVTGDRGGMLVVTPIEGPGLALRPRRRVMLSSTVLAVASLDDREILVWCRRGALTLTWT